VLLSYLLPLEGLHRSPFKIQNRRFAIFVRWRHYHPVLAKAHVRQNHDSALPKSESIFWNLVSAPAAVTNMRADARL
jgi:hypothetical protein